MACSILCRETSSGRIFSLSFRVARSSMTLTLALLDDYLKMNSAIDDRASTSASEISKSIEHDLIIWPICALVMEECAFLYTASFP